MKYLTNFTRQNKAQILLFTLGVIFLCAGLAQGGYRDTLHKAIRVCLECIGIG